MTDQELIEVAKAYRERAYAAYSHFKVGAAVLTKDGKVFGGCNIENASHPVSNCAERSVRHLQGCLRGISEFAAIAIAADTPARAHRAACARPSANSRSRASSW